MSPVPHSSTVEVAEPRLPSAPSPAHPDTVCSHDEWEHERIEAADLTGQQADHVEITGSMLRGVRFTGARLEHLRLTDVLAVDCELSGAFPGCDLRRAVFTKAKMAGTSFHGSTIDELAGAAALRGIVVGTDQVLPLALSVFRDLGIVVSDEGENVESAKGRSAS